MNGRGIIKHLITDYVLPKLNNLLDKKNELILSSSSTSLKISNTNTYQNYFENVELNLNEKRNEIELKYKIFKDEL